MLSFGANRQNTFSGSEEKSLSSQERQTKYDSGVFGIKEKKGLAGEIRQSRLKIAQIFEEARKESGL